LVSRRLVAVIATALLAHACGSGGDSGFGVPGDAATDTSAGAGGVDASAGSGGAAGSGGTKPGCTVLPDCDGCTSCYTTCICAGRTPGDCSQLCSGAGGQGGFGGFGGSGGSGAFGGSSGAGGSSGPCDPIFCPTGPGSPCCVSPTGPCGCNAGLGCQQAPGPDI
jgi:hypothetical protein